MSLKILYVRSFFASFSTQKICVQRIKTRQICPGCSKVYNTRTAQPKVVDSCDSCHS